MQKVVFPFEPFLTHIYLLSFLEVAQGPNFLYSIKVSKKQNLTLFRTNEKVAKSHLNSKNEKTDGKTRVCPLLVLYIKVFLTDNYFWWTIWTVWYQNQIPGLVASHLILSTICFFFYSCFKHLLLEVQKHPFQRLNRDQTLKIFNFIEF